MTMFKGGYGVELEVNHTNINQNTVVYLRQGYRPVWPSPPPHSSPASSSGGLSGGAIAGARPGRLCLLFGVHM
jgi:hypothetical protein